MGEEGKILGKEFINVSLSEGTLIEEDIFKSVKLLLPKEIQNDFLNCIDREEKCYIMENIFDYLNEIAPEGCYFGAHEGNGSDFGFWEIPEY